MNNNYPHITKNSKEQTISVVTRFGTELMEYYPSGNLKSRSWDWGYLRVSEYLDNILEQVKYEKNEDGSESWWDNDGNDIPNPDLPKSGDKYTNGGFIYTLVKLPHFESAWILVENSYDELSMFTDEPQKTPELTGINYMTKIIK